MKGSPLEILIRLSKSISFVKNFSEMEYEDWLRLDDFLLGAGTLYETLGVLCRSDALDVAQSIDIGDSGASDISYPIYEDRTPYIGGRQVNLENEPECETFEASQRPREQAGDFGASADDKVTDPVTASGVGLTDGHGYIYGPAEGGDGGGYTHPAEDYRNREDDLQHNEESSPVEMATESYCRPLEHVGTAVGRFELTITGPFVTSGEWLVDDQGYIYGPDEDDT